MVRIQRPLLSVRVKPGLMTHLLHHCLLSEDDRRWLSGSDSRSVNSILTT